MFIGKYDKSVVVTFLGTLSAMIGMYFILGYDEPRLTGAIICLIIAGICDMFDGKVARMCKLLKLEVGKKAAKLMFPLMKMLFVLISLYFLNRLMSI